MWYTGKIDWRKIEQTFFMHLHIIIWQEEQRHNVRSKPDNTISIFMTKGAKSLNLWAPISVIMKQEYRGVQKKWIKCERAKMVCTVDTQLTSANLLLMIWLCSFHLIVFMGSLCHVSNKLMYVLVMNCFCVHSSVILFSLVTSQLMK